tara:strand:- start:586 stop:936 length:351 start_codon:yes stop_codon:yes gene_type:complete
LQLKALHNKTSNQEETDSTYAPSGSTTLQEKHEGKIKQEFSKEWVVIVWNDPVNLMSYVTFVFQKLFGYSQEKAESLMLDVHHKGKAVVSRGTKEKSELDVFQLHEYGLWATMRQD